MKRMTLIAAALCVIMLTTAGVGIVAAKQTENPRQAGASSIYFYNVQATGSHGTGKLMIDAKQGTLVFNGKGFDSSKLYTLRYWIAGSTDVRVFASEKASPSGNLHITGTWPKDAPLPTTPGFGVDAVLGNLRPGDVVTGTLTQFVIVPGAGISYYIFETPSGTFHIYGLPTAYALVGDQATATVVGSGTTARGDIVYFVDVVVNQVTYTEMRMYPVTAKESIRIL